MDFGITLSLISNGHNHCIANIKLGDKIVVSNSVGRGFTATVIGLDTKNQKYIVIGSHSPLWEFYSTIKFNDTWFRSLSHTVLKEDHLDYKFRRWLDTSLGWIKQIKKTTIITNHKEE